ncbi:MAG TPA: hypothetical protein VH436_21600 [Vicinamibacterales bacterium]|jgi:hypothetical protein
MQPFKTLFLLSCLLVSMAGAACGGADKSAPGAVAAPPSRSGDIWEIQAPAERTSVPGSIVAFVNGVHVMVVDGDQIYAGMTTLATKSGPNGGRTITFPSGLTADMVSGSQGAELRFSSGERVMVHERQ